MRGNICCHCELTNKVARRVVIGRIRQSAWTSRRSFHSNWEASVNDICKCDFLTPQYIILLLGQTSPPTQCEHHLKMVPYFLSLSLPSHEPALRSSCRCLVFRSHLIPIAVSSLCLLNCQTKSPSRRFLAPQEMHVCRAKISNLCNRAPPPSAAVASLLRSASCSPASVVRPSVRVRASPFKFPPLLFPPAPAWSVVASRGRKAREGRPDTFFCRKRMSITGKIGIGLALAWHYFVPALHVVALNRIVLELH